ncbi:MAG: hypothetical protein AAGF23_27725, partial [Acidobacteriota bacterium]
MIHRFLRLFASPGGFFTAAPQTSSTAVRRGTVPGPRRLRRRAGLALLASTLGLGSQVGAQEFELVIDQAPGSTQIDLINDVVVGDGAFVGGYAIFQGCTDAFGCEPWRSDGTALGTEMLVDVDPGPRTGLDFGAF